MDTLLDNFVPPSEFARQLGVSLATVQAWIRSGVLPCVRLGKALYIPKDALRLMLLRQEGS